MAHGNFLLSNQGLKIDFSISPSS